MSTEESGYCLEATDFMNNRILDDILPLSMKIGGPDARTYNKRVKDWSVWISWTHGRDFVWGKKVFRSNPQIS